ncbi:MULTISPECIES: Na+/H+ antiporter NhaC [unclassified Sporosarcina]|uniref:Na+/H+ antiporter NhaC n=1 Tax=unclassified Sporosarcina TaxID=2647733 RepID=UPI0020402B44|nr:MULTISPECIES: Na+/H+ antiporter NhaC [unclassified Sporosarcina]GKV65933.1 Na+/H+ antiporter NhaC [Sporosarcina sp. NCCP-2331]GLB56067.1 Na+/H+ antiporter NhaC [Sporosarcina sp. NCCP-2378]
MKTVKNAKFSSSALLIAIILFVIIYGVMFAGFPVESVLITAGILVTIFAILHGHKWEQIMGVMAEKIKTALVAILVLYSIGWIIGAWMMSGTIPYFIYLGLEIINPQYLYIMAFFGLAIVSLCIGSSFSSAGTLGVAVMGIAAAMDVNLAITAGAVVSGAYFGDKLSPLSDTVIMSSLVAEVNVYDHIKHLMFTSIPSTIVAATVFFIAGLKIEPSEFKSESIANVSNTLQDLFNMNFLLIIPAIIVIGGSLMKKPVLIVLFLSSFTAMLLSFFVQHQPLSQVIQAAIEGFNLEMLTSVIPSLQADQISEDVQVLLNRGGIYSMHQPVLTVFCAFFFAAAVEVSGALRVVLSKTLSYIKSTTNTILISLVSGLAIILATGNSYVTFFLMKDTFAEQYKKRSLNQLNLSRSMEDGGMIPEALVPWTVAGIYMASTLGVSVIEYAPWAIFNMFGIIFSALLAILGPYTNWFGIKRNVDNHEIESQSCELNSSEK